MKIKGWLLVFLGVLAALVVIVHLRGGGRREENPLFPGFEAELAHRIIIDSRQSRTVLERQDGIWIVTSEDSFPAEAGAADKILERVADFVRKDIISNNPAKQSIYQVDSSGIDVRIEDTAGARLASFIVGKVGPDYRSTFVRDSASNEVLLVPSYLAGTFERGKRTWQDLAIFALEPTDITDMRLSRPDETVVFARGEAGEWVMSRPESAACDHDRVQKLARTLANLRSDEIVGHMPVAGSGLEEPDSLVWFRLTDGREEGLLFGSPVEGKSVYTKRLTDDVVYKLPSYRVRSLLPGLDRLRAQEESDTRATSPAGQ